MRGCGMTPSGGMVVVGAVVEIRWFGTPCVCRLVSPVSPWCLSLGCMCLSMSVYVCVCAWGMCVRVLALSELATLRGCGLWGMCVFVSVCLWACVTRWTGRNGFPWHACRTRPCGSTPRSGCRCWQATACFVAERCSSYDPQKHRFCSLSCEYVSVCSPPFTLLLCTGFGVFVQWHGKHDRARHTDGGGTG